MGYKRYGVQGDWGAIIGTGLALQHPEAVLGLHLNMVAGTGGVPEGVTLSPAEREYLEFRDGWNYENQGYDHIQSTRPQTLTYAHNDSLVGLLGWIVEKFWAWSDHGDDLWQTFDKDLVLTNVMLYWLPGRALSVASIYFEMERGRYEFLAGRVEVPTGYARFPWTHGGHLGRWSNGSTTWSITPNSHGEGTLPRWNHRSCSQRMYRPSSPVCDDRTPAGGQPDSARTGPPTYFRRFAHPSRSGPCQGSAGLSRCRRRTESGQPITSTDSTPICTFG